MRTVFDADPIHIFDLLPHLLRFKGKEVVIKYGGNAMLDNQLKRNVIRDIVFKERLLQPKIPVLDQKSYAELKRIGTNLNQVAKKLNANAKAPEIEKTVKELKVTVNQILNKLLHDR